MAGFSLTDSQQVSCILQGTDAAGNPATLPVGSAVWAVDNPALLALTVSSDTLTGTVVAVGPLGTANLSVKFNDTSGNQVASGQLEIDVVGGAPTVITIVPGTPSQK